MRRAFLCGTDRLTGKSFDHHKSWIVEKLAELSAIFAVRVRAYGSGFTSIQQRLQEVGEEQRQAEEKAAVGMVATAQGSRRPDLFAFARPGEIETSLARRCAKKEKVAVARIPFAESHGPDPHQLVLEHQRS